jgi:hypothetical protein
MKNSTKAALSASGYTLDHNHFCQMSDTTVQNVWVHEDGSRYTVTTMLDAQNRETVVKSWFYRGLGGSAKGQWYPYMRCNPDLNDNDQTLAQHAKRNRKTTPKTKIARRTRQQMRADNFVMYD